jgi:hypothetical protein
VSPSNISLTGTDLTQVSDFLAFQFKLIYNWLNINRSLLDDGGVFPAIYEKEASPY